MEMTPQLTNSAPDFSRVTVNDLIEKGLWSLSEPERVAARAAIALDRMVNRTKHPLTTAFINKRS